MDVKGGERVAAASAAVDAALFRDTMAAFPSGVAVVTTKDRTGAPRGLTTTAVCSVSVDPPLLLVCVDHQSRTLPALLDRRAFVVNFLEAGGHFACTRFASKIDDKFDGCAWSESASGLPVLVDAGGWLECEIEQSLNAGDHLVLIGRVTEGVAPPHDHEPIVYYRRMLGRWAQS